ncbi:MAG TPA: HAD-IA family hydrolase [Hyphomicrobiaceae bacterium]|nr:HAD-IA family hydrolase [Hyphomicrobiaceae bacterium]
MPAYDAVAFDLLTALIDSWTLWNSIAGSPETGMRWRKRYLEITYGCGAYRPYQKLVQEAGADVGLPASCAESLQLRWEELTPWPEVPAVLGRLAARLPLGIVTNCSERLGRMAAARAGSAFKVVITAERAGYYKPRPEPYRALLEALGTRPERTLFVAGSASDVPGAGGLGMPVFWHNRIGLPPRDGAQAEFCEASLARLPQIVLADG